MRFFLADICSTKCSTQCVTHDLGTRIEIAQHGRPARLNRLVNRNLAAVEIVTPPSY